MPNLLNEDLGRGYARFLPAAIEMLMVENAN
jgi:hypothetical protein